MIPTDVKTPMTEVPSGAELPVYRLDESNEELIVGSTRRGPRAWWQRMKVRCAERKAQRAANGGCCRHSCVGRIFKWLFTLALIFTVARFFVMRHFTANHRATCVPVNETTTSITLPFTSERARIFLHHSVTGGDSHIIHSDTVANGTINFTFELPSATDLSEEDTPEELFVCTIAKPRGVGLGLFTRGHDSLVPAVSSITVKVNQDIHSPKVNFLGKQRGCTRRSLRKWMIDSAIARYDEAKVDSAEWVIVD